MTLVPSLLQAIIRLDGEAVVMHVGDRPYVVTPNGQVDLATRGLTFEAVTGIVNQLLPADSQHALDEFGAAQYELPAMPEFPGESFTIVAARGGDDVWAEIRRRQVTDEERAAADAAPPEPEPVPELAPVRPEPVPPSAIPTVAQPLAHEEADRDDDLGLPDASQLWPHPGGAATAAHPNDDTLSMPAAEIPIGRDTPAAISSDQSAAFIHDDDDGLGLPDVDQLWPGVQRETSGTRIEEPWAGVWEAAAPTVTPPVGESPVPIASVEIPSRETPAPIPIVEPPAPFAAAESIASVETPKPFEPVEIPTPLAAVEPPTPIETLEPLTPIETVEPLTPIETVELTPIETVELTPIETEETPVYLRAALQGISDLQSVEPISEEPPPAIHEAETPLRTIVDLTSRIFEETQEQAEEEVAIEDVHVPVAEPPAPVVEIVADSREVHAPPVPAPAASSAAAPPARVVWPDEATIESHAPVFRTVVPEPVPPASVVPPTRETAPTPPALPKPVGPIAPPAVAPSAVAPPAAAPPQPIAAPAATALPHVRVPATSTPPPPVSSVSVPDQTSIQESVLPAVVPPPQAPRPVLETPIPLPVAAAAPPAKAEELPVQIRPKAESVPVPAAPAAAPPVWQSAPAPPVREPMPGWDNAAASVEPAISPVWPAPPPVREPVSAQAWPAAPRTPAGPSSVIDNQATPVLPLTRSAIRPDVPPPLAEQSLSTLDQLLRLAAARGASMLYLSSAARPSVRVDGEIYTLDGAPLLGPNDVESLLLTLMPERNAEALRTGVASEWICDLPEVGRVRCLSFRDHRGPGGVFRMMPVRAITAEQLGLSREIQALGMEPEGLVLVAGPRASGKRTLISAFVDLINRTRRDHIISVESEINVVHERNGSLISQREVRGGAEEMYAAARGALREDPDVLVLEEVRTGALMNLALEAAASGHLVIGGFPAHNASGAVDRIIDLYPPEYRRQVQLSLAQNLRGVVSQVLLRKRGGGRLAAREVLLNTPAVSSVLAEGRTSQLPLAIEGGRKVGMMPLNDALVGYVQSGAVDVQEAYRRSADRGGFLALLKRQGVDTSAVERLA